MVGARPLPAAGVAVATGLAAAGLVAAWLPGTWLWSVHHPRFLAPLPGWALWALGAVALIPPAGRALAPALGAAGRALARGGWGVALAAAAGGALLAWLLPDRTRFVGDSLLRLNTLETGRLSIAVSSHVALPLELLLHETLPRGIQAALGVSIEDALRLLGAARAALWGALAARVVAAVRGDGGAGGSPVAPVARGAAAVARGAAVSGRGAAGRAVGAGAADAAAAAAFAVVFFAGPLALWTGYSKSLADLALVTLWAGFTALRVAREGRGWVSLGIAVAVAFALHRSGALVAAWLPAAWLGRRGAAGFSIGRERGAWLAAGLAAASLAAWAPAWLEAARRFDAPHLGGAGVGAALAAAFAPLRLLDLANLVAAVCPLALALPALLLPARDGAAEAAPWRDSAGRVLIPVAALYALEALFVHPQQGLFRDHDVFAAAATAWALAAAWAFARAPGESGRTGAALARGARAQASMTPAPARAAPAPARAAPAPAWIAPALALCCASAGLRPLALAADLDRGLARAEAFVTEAPRRTPRERAETWDFLGLAGRRHQRWDLAARAFGAAAADAPSPRILMLAGHAEAQRGNDGAAIDYFRRSLERDPEQPVVWRFLARVAFRSHRDAEALAAAREWLARAPDDAEARAFTAALDSLARAAAGPAAR